jgi:hypothetical protein
MFVQAIGFRNDHVKHDGEGFNYHHAHAAMVMIFEAKGCVTWCPKRLQNEDHTYISGSMDERIMMLSRCLHEPQQKTIRYSRIFRSCMKSTLQRIKRQGNRRFLQADMAESRWLHMLKFWTASSAEVKHNRTSIKANEYPLER